MTREFEHSLDRLPSLKREKPQTEAKSSSLRSGHSLDIKEATRGQFVVKAQDTDISKAQQENEDVKDMPVATTSNKVGIAPRSSASRNVGHFSLGPHRLVLLQVT